MRKRRNLDCGVWDYDSQVIVMSLEALVNPNTDRYIVYIVKIALRVGGRD